MRTKAPPRKTGIYLSKGNIRMKAAIFNISECVTCMGSTELCRKYCYAKKASRFYPGVKESRDTNFQETFKDSFVPDMIAAINKRKNPYVRIHEAGDFYSQEYLNKWFEIIKGCPDKMFLVYTQCYDLDYSEKPDNLVLYWTVWDDSVNIPDTGLFAYVLDNGKDWSPIKETNVPDREKLFICGKGKRYDTCNQCGVCWNGSSDVGFELH